MGFGTLPADRLRARAHGKYVRINHAKLAAAKGRRFSKQLILFRKR